MSEATISVLDSQTLLLLFGPRDQHLRAIREALGVSVAAQGNQVRVTGDDAAVARATKVLEQIKSAVERQGAVSSEEVQRLLYRPEDSAPHARLHAIEVMNAGRRVSPRSAGQVAYVEAILNHDVVFCVGPAGTGKTYLAVAMAVASLKTERIRKIVLVRPAVEAGESLGYLPGDLQAKINPYLRPLLDALREMMDYDQMKRYLDRDLIEVIPLAYMRGRSLNEAFIILDEAQNTTVAQMKMFLTRMGNGSKVVVSGDTTQTDLPPQVVSGLVDAVERLRGIEGVAQVTLTTADIVRHPLVHKIVMAYEREAEKRP
jgi:phosphate starvation-inducible PhoH-like protein